MSGLPPGLRSPWLGEGRTSATTQESGRNADTSATIRTIDDERGRITAAKRPPESPQTTAASDHHVARSPSECKDVNRMTLWIAGGCHLRDTVRAALRT